MRRFVFVSLLGFACSPAPPAAVTPAQVGSPDAPAPAPSSAATAEATPSASAPPGMPAIEESAKCGKCQQPMTCLEVGEIASCVQLLDMERVAGRDDLDGRTVGIRGGELKAGTSCTKMMCPPERPCCNSCSATMFFSANAVSIAPTQAGSEIRCPKGNNCDVVKSCPLKEGRYNAIGKLVSQPVGGYYELEVSALAPAP